MDYLLFDIFKDLLKKDQSEKLYLDFKSSPTHFLKILEHHFISLRQVLKMYKELRGSMTLTDHLDETYL